MKEDQTAFDQPKNDATGKIVIRVREIPEPDESRCDTGTIKASQAEEQSTTAESQKQQRVPIIIRPTLPTAQPHVATITANPAEVHHVVQRAIPTPTIKVSATPISETVKITKNELLTADIEILKVEPLRKQEAVVIKPGPAKKIVRIDSRRLPSPSPRIVVRAEDLIRTTIIREPIEGAQVGERPLTVRGEAEPNTRLEIAIDQTEYHAETQAAPDGAFRFEAVPLHDEWNLIRVWSTTYPRSEKGRASIQVFRRNRPLLYIGIQDLFSGRKLSEQDDVVRCQRCNTFSLRDSWEWVPGCAKYGCRSRQFYTRDNDEFYNDQNPGDPIPIRK